MVHHHGYVEVCRHVSGVALGMAMLVRQSIRFGKICQQLLDELPLNFVQTFLVPRGGIQLMLGYPEFFVLQHQSVKVFAYLLKYFSIEQWIDTRFCADIQISERTNQMSSVIP